MESIAFVIVGVVCIIIGILNRKGNISMLHSYHRKRVSEENVLPFGKMVGLGMIIIGAALIFAGIFSFVAINLDSAVCSIVSNVTLIVGLLIGLAITLYAMIKYNRSVF